MRPAIRSSCGWLCLAVTTLLVISFCPRIALAQKAGDVAILGGTIGPVSASGAVYDRTGKYIVGIPVSSSFGGLAAGTAAPDNDGILFLAPRFRLPVASLLLKFNGAVTTLAPMPSGWAPRRTRVGQNGDPILLIQGPSLTTSGIYRLVAGSFRRIATGFSTPGGLGEDIDTGNFVVVDNAGTVTVVSRTGTIISTRPNVFASNVGAMEDEYSTGAQLIANGALLRYDVKNNVVTTALAAASSGYGAIDWDPAFGGYWAATGKGLEWLDRNLNRTQISQWGLFFALSVVSWGSRNLTGQVPPAIGSAYAIVLSMPGEALQSYQAAASFGTRPGIPTVAGTVHLNPDPLFSLSLSAPAIFSGFSGTLTANGTAQLTVNLPNVGALRGLRFFVAAVSYDIAGIRRVSEPLGVNVR